VNGKKLFAGEGQCGSCHTLARAGTRGTQGPNLDDAFANAREEGMGESVIEGVVHEQIKYPRRASIMKPDLVTGQDARDVAAYVASAAAKPGDDTGLLASVGAVDNSNKVAKAQGGKLEIPADPSGALAFEFGKAESPAGEIAFSMPNPAPIPHNIALEQPAIEGDVVNEGGTSAFSVTLKKGEYTYLCTVPGHAEGGMTGTLTVK
jgi:plastocyanin